MAAGRKMYLILYLKSGQGWGKGIITDFIQHYVLGTQLVYKTSDPQTILGNKVTSDTIEIHEKYKTPTQYKNFMSTIVLTNENALQVENDDRRTVFLDVSLIQKGNLEYFKKLGNAIKYPNVSEAFYAYLRLDINSNRVYINGKQTRVLNITREELYQKYVAKNWIYETDDIDGIEDVPQNRPTADLNALD
ncbi:hypothetical protein C1646_773930 [Rhizophagus diaphanus]|nr:hypothetical protein C1646_773930 [Rhizophagus diaphanus] [Rhizophagus sp. MUCL 43196]